MQQKDLLEAFSYIAIIFGTVLALVQYKLNSIQMKEAVKRDKELTELRMKSLSMEIAQIELKQVQKAIELAEYYKDNILRLFEAVDYVYRNAGIQEILCAIKDESMIDFDSVELYRTLSKENIEKLRGIQKSEEFAKCVMEADQIFNMGLSQGFVSQIVSDEVSDEKKKIFRVDITGIVNTFLREYVNAILNNLEYFAMNFSHGAADETVVYQSLHQTYLEIVHTFYYSICALNEPMQSRYYTNTIELYQKWHSRKLEQEEEIEQTRRKTTRKGTTISV